MKPFGPDEALDPLVFWNLVRWVEHVHSSNAFSPFESVDILGRLGPRTTGAQGAIDFVEPLGPWVRLDASGMVRPMVPVDELAINIFSALFASLETSGLSIHGLLGFFGTSRES